MVRRFLQWWRGPKPEPTEQERLRERINRGEFVTVNEALIAIGPEATQAWVERLERRPMPPPRD